MICLQITEKDFRVTGLEVEGQMPGMYIEGLAIIEFSALCMKPMILGGFQAYCGSKNPETMYI